MRRHAKRGNHVRQHLAKNGWASGAGGAQWFSSGGTFHIRNM